MVAAEAAKAYPPPQITSVIKELGMKSGMESSVKYLTTKETANIQMKGRKTATSLLTVI